MSSSAGLFQVITFATDLRRGNPAFVLTDAGDAPDGVLAAVCDLLRVEVIAVVDEPASDEPALRFFTPDGPHAGAGHATLAVAHVALRHRSRSDGQAGRIASFRLPDGGRRVARVQGDRIAITYPSMPAQRVDCIAELEAALGMRPVESWLSSFGYIGIFAEAAAIVAMRPDLARVAAFDRPAVIATAPGGAAAEVVVRVFAPSIGLPEDPVCGTAHRIIIPYWAGRTGKSRLHSRHLSPRGGDLWCEVAGDDVIIAGESRLVIAGTVELSER